MRHKKSRSQDLQLSLPFEQSLDSKLDIKARSLPLYYLIPMFWIHFDICWKADNGEIAVMLGKPLQLIIFILT